MYRHTLFQVLVLALTVSQVRCAYRVHIKTSRHMWAATACEVYIYLHGHKGSSGKIHVPGGRYINTWINTYVSADYGYIHQADIYLEDKDCGIVYPPWHMERFDITDENTGVRLEMNTETWFNPGDRKPFLFSVDGRWSDFGSYSSCSKSCGPGTQYKHRYCNDPPPRNGGRTCSGSSTSSRNCNNGNCPVDGRYGPWSDYTLCSLSCGGGTQTRTRVCIGPEYGGRPCVGPTSETRACGTKPCPVDGIFSPWSNFTACCASCGGGTQIRIRICIEPEHGGKPCDGPSTETRECGTSPCPVDGGYGAWSNAGECSKPCGGGTQNYSRLCNYPEPAHGGKDCEGPSIEVRQCNESPCGTCCATGDGVHSCRWLRDDQYQSCKTCYQYIVCSNFGGLESVMDCPVRDPNTGERLMWDDYLKACVVSSSTCTEPTNM